MLEIVPDAKPGLMGAKAEIIRPAAKSRFFTAFELGRMEFPELQEIVPGVLVEGLGIVAGPPKMGKSYAATDMAIAVGIGGKAFGAIQCEQGDVLYLALEDGQRRLQSRLRQMLPYADDLPERITFATSVPQIGDGLEAIIEGWIASVERPRLIVIDTWRCVKPEATGRGSAYDEDARAIQPLHEMTKAHPGLCILIVHHTRKMESDDTFATISGTYGLTGVADTLLVLARHGEGHKLCIRGRDIEDAEKALQRDRLTGGWKMTGDARELAKTSERQEIVDLLDEAAADDKPLSLAQIASALGKPKSTLGTLLKRLEGEGLVEKAGYGKYRRADPHRKRRNCRNSPRDDGETDDSFDTFDTFDGGSEDD